MPALSGNSGKDSGKQEMMFVTKEAAARWLKIIRAAASFSLFDFKENQMFYYFFLIVTVFVLL